jgi:hypothetical protein
MRLVPREKIKSVLNMENQQDLVDTRRKKWLWLIVGLMMIIIWQSIFLVQRSHLKKEKIYRQNASTGISKEAQFIYFYHYLGLYPLASTHSWNELAFSRVGAEKALQDPSTLRTEIRNTTRYGDHGKVWLFFPHVWLFGFDPPPNVLAANSAAFILGLILVYAAACHIRRPILGLALVAFIGSNPFQLYETYFRQDVFCWPFIVLLLIIATHLPLAAGPNVSKWRRWATPIAAGVLLATIRQVRTEPITILAGVGLSYLVLNPMKLRQRFLMLMVLVVVFFAGSQLWRSYFSHKIETTETMLREIGGTPYNGPRDAYHLVWHPIWCGLGDFDKKYGYAWDDRVAASLVEKIKQDPGLKLSGKSYVYDTYWDDKKYYFKTPYELPGYTEIIKAEILQDIVHDPLWYGGILLKRLLRLATETSPLRLAMGQYKIQFNFPMFLLSVPVCILAILSPGRMALMLIIISLSTSITAFVIFSGKNMTMYSSYHLISASLALNWVVEYLWTQRKESTQKRIKA